MDSCGHNESRRDSVGTPHAASQGQENCNFAARTVFQGEPRQANSTLPNGRQSEVDAAGKESEAPLEN